MRAADLAGIAALELPDHSPDSIAFTALDNLQRRRALKYLIRSSQPLSNCILLDDCRERFEQTDQLVQTIRRSLHRQSAGARCRKPEGFKPENRDRSGRSSECQIPFPLETATALVFCCEVLRR